MQPAPSFASLVHPTADPTRSDVFLGPPAPERRGRTYGGQFLAQAVMAAAVTVDPPKVPHSLHASFVRGGEVDTITRYRVERIREGRSFALRSVVADQARAEVFRLTVSFHAPEPGPEYQPDADPAPQNLAPPSESLPDYPAFAAGHPHFDPDGWDGALRPMEMRYVNPPDPAGGPPVTEPQLMWVRILGESNAEDSPALAAARLAYLSDGALIDHALLPHGRRWFDRALTGASLDHAMWLHRLPRVGVGDPGWLLYDQRVEWTGSARGLVTGRFRDGDGRLLATCTQEGLIRWRDDAETGDA